jgi:hypothetical protein
LQLNNKHKDIENFRIEGIASSRLKIKFPLEQEFPLLKKTVILRQCKIRSIQIISNPQAAPKQSIINIKTDISELKKK